ncbi:UxaA family hydrolase [Pelistega europaea]|uniref:UxaA family hydrolase n=1 Tax=Pelistega europaea TaxID=106147 RepID=A0A7Y4LB38_9BURK|nr:UxaA family hydrolase [Pelistega europaea]NOL50285.1 UxaA family hydrolase [Pelistega europaea]
MIHAILHDTKDTVAVVVLEGLEAGQKLNCWNMETDEIIEVEAKQAIPIGHKVALTKMSLGDTVFKYGTDIGKVVQAIEPGEHAHVHNIKTKRW